MVQSARLYEAWKANGSRFSMFTGRKAADTLTTGIVAILGRYVTYGAHVRGHNVINKAVVIQCIHHELFKASLGTPSPMGPGAEL